MQRAGHDVVRGAVVTVLSALLLVLTGPFAGAQAPAAGHAATRSAGSGVHRSAGLDLAPAVAPQAHRPGHLQRPEGTPAALVPDRAGSPLPSYATRVCSARTDPVRATPRATVHGRAPPA